MTSLKPLRDKIGIKQTINTLLKVSSVEWLNNNGTNIDAAGLQQPYWKAYGDIKVLRRQQEHQLTTVRNVQPRDYT